MPKQRTIRIPQECRGVGVHSGEEVTLSIKPAPPDTGIIFVRTDLKNKPSIPAHISSVADTRNATTIGTGTATVSTVEHLMAAARGMGIDNLIVEINGPEVPIMDGSAAPFVTLFKRAKCTRQDAKRSYLVIKKPVVLHDGDKKAGLYPLSRPHLRISYTIQYSHPCLNVQTHDVEFTNGTFIKEISPARTYGFVHEINGLMELGLIRGGSMENAVVIGDHGVLNPGGLRFYNECVRHKILDSIGDLSLVGMPVLGHLVAYKSGHSLNLKLLAALLEEKDCWEIVSASPSIPGSSRITKESSYSPKHAAA